MNIHKNDLQEVYIHHAEELWPELTWINNLNLRSCVKQTWALALQKSVLTTKDLNEIPFTLLCGPDFKVSFMTHKRAVVHISKDCGEQINKFFKSDLPVDMDTLIAGAILCDVGKLLEYEIVNGKPAQSSYGQYLRHPFSGVSIAEECNVPPSVCHIIATHAGEGNIVKRSIEAYIVHHADFMTFEPFRERLK